MKGSNPMPSYEHTKLAERIAAISSPPGDSAGNDAWLEARGHLQLLEDNAKEEELIIHTLDSSIFIHTVVVAEDRLSPLDKNDLLRWNGNAFDPRAVYVWGGGRNDVSVEDNSDNWASETLKNSRHLVFGRHRQGFSIDNGTYYEILQEYVHLSAIHWRPEQLSYCHFGEDGDLEHAVSFTLRKNSSNVDLVSFQRSQLEHFLAATNSALVRMFDFTLRVNEDSFDGWPDTPEVLLERSDDLFAMQKVDPGKAAYTRGVQIIRPARPVPDIMREIKSGRKEKRHVEFMAWDRRHGQLSCISTDPSATTNYFEAEMNDLPFEVSPAFFQPDVLVKYKNDRDKYTVLEEHRSILCRGGWGLRSYDINEAGQISAYIVDLRSLPYREQLYWKSFNVEPKSGISQRAFDQDIKGEWIDVTTPLEDTLAVIRAWAHKEVAWWKLRSEGLLERVNTPYANGRDEWAGAFLALAKLVIEGFEVGTIRKSLRRSGLSFSDDDKSLALLEKLLIGAGAPSMGARLEGLREVQRVRTLVASHASGDAATELERGALKKHGGYTQHFESVCTSVVNELRLIEQGFLGKAM